MKRMTYTGESAANTDGEFALGTPGKTEYVDIISLDISTRGGDVAADAEIQIKDSAEVRWAAFLRSAKDYGKSFSNIGIIKMTDAFTIYTGQGGANCIVVVSCVYNCLTKAEELKLRATI